MYDGMEPQELRELLIRYIRSNDDRKQEVWFALRRHYLIERWRFLDACERDPMTRELAKRVVYSKDGFWFFMRTFGVVFEPRRNMPEHGLLPFIPYPHQEDVAMFFFEVLEDGDVGLALKTRDMGVSWVAYHQLAWMWLREEDFSCIMGSATEDWVDTSAGKADENTMFGRIEIIIQNLPVWLRPGLDATDKDQRQHLWWRNPNNGNVIFGKAATSNFGRQGRATVGLVDEFDHWKDAMGAITAIRDTCGAVWLITTPSMKGEQVAKRIIDEEKARVLELPWEIHPLKTREWYEKTKKQRFEESAATELDLSFDGNKSLLIYPEWDRVVKGSFPFRPDWHTYGGIDFGRSDGTALVWVQHSFKSGRFNLLASHYRAGETIDHFLPYLGGPMLSGHSEYSQREIALIDKSKAWAKGEWGVEWFGDPAGRQKTALSNQSVLERLSEHRIYVRTNPRAISHADRQSAVHSLLRQSTVNMDECAMLDWSMRRYKRAAATPNQTSEWRIKPVHNRASHVATALEYVAVNLPDPESYVVKPKPQRRAAVWE